MLADELKKFKPEATNSTIKAYIKNLVSLSKKMNREKDLQTLTFLQKVEDVNDVLKHLAKSTRRNYLNAVIVALKAKDAEEDLISAYQKIRNNYNDELREEWNSNIKSEKQKKNWFKISDMDKVIKLLKDRVANNSKKKGNITMKDILEMQEWVIVSLYRKFPLRNDFHNMVVLKKKSWKKHPNKETKNFLVLDGRDMEFILNDYKTKKTFGQQTIKVPKDLKRVLRIWLQVNPTKYFLINNKKQPLTSNGITKLLTRIFERYLGKKISSTMIRHVYLSEKYGKEHEEMKKDATLMMHDPLTQKGYIKK
jgi:site-specific recombinase XerD